MGAVFNRSSRLCGRTARDGPERLCDPSLTLPAAYAKRLPPSGAGVSVESMNGEDADVMREALPPRWLAWAVEIQFLAQAGIAYSKDPYDLERFERLREIAAEIMGAKSGLDMETVRGLFCSETGFQTPKMDTRAAIFRGGKILLVQEKDSGLWSLPGGWVDVNQSVRDNTVKEAWEESGLRVEPLRLIALHDRNRHNPPPYAYGVCKIFVLCEERGGCFRPNAETFGSGWFGREELPPLALEKNTPEQVRLCFDAAADPCWNPVFD